MLAFKRPWGTLHYTDQGPKKGPMVVFANSLGTDLRLWDDLIPHLPDGLRLVRFDKPGHGLSDVQAGVSIDSMADDVAALITALGGENVVFVGLSVGGLIAQALAQRHAHLLRAVVISNSAAKIGNAETWDARITAIQTAGIAAIAATILERWFAPKFRKTPAFAVWRNMLINSPRDGYVAICQAIAAADYSGATADMTLPTLVIAGELDGSTPPELVAATAGLIAGAEFHIVPGAAHLPCVETPAAYAAVLNAFLNKVNHV